MLPWPPRAVEYSGSVALAVIGGHSFGSGLSCLRNTALEPPCFSLKHSLSKRDECTCQKLKMGWHDGV